jgi:hypothetical protein
MKWTRRFSRFGFVLALLAGVSCTTADSNPMEPVAPPIQLESQPLLLDGLGGLVGGVGDLLGGVVDVVGGVVSGLLDITGVLSCQQQQYDVDYETIGPWGGTVRVGKHALVVPRGALGSYVRIKAEQMQGPTNSVRFSPEGLQFQKPATLILNYENCQNVGTPKAVVYTTEQFDIIEVLRSLDFSKSSTVTAPIDHFSRYAVAY